jgi:hypothetical protein
LPANVNVRISSSVFPVQRYDLAALHAVHGVDGQLLRAHILGCIADQAARDARAAEAVTRIESAMVGMRGRETPRLLAEL